MTTSIQLEGLHRIAHGGQADIYDFGEGKVLRVGRRPQDIERIRYEYAVYSCLAGTDSIIPIAYELTEAGGLPAILMQRLDGPSMMDQIKANPMSAKTKARQLAELHLRIGKLHAPEQIVDVKAKAKFCIDRSEALHESAKESILDILKKLPDGTNLCHGDFHPGNIIVQKEHSYIIDWSAASRGDCPASSITNGRRQLEPRPLSALRGGGDGGRKKIALRLFLKRYRPMALASRHLLSRSLAYHAGVILEVCARNTP
jgi:predicted Ser/Thr protein kinase